MDSLPEDEIEAIWQRNKKYIDVNQIKSVSTKMIQDEIREALRTANVPQEREVNPQSTSEFLVAKGFPEEAAKNQKILTELLQDNVREIQVRGASRFQIAKGTPTFIDLEGKQVRAGQFLAGKNQSEAVEKLIKKGTTIKWRDIFVSNAKFRLGWIGPLEENHLQEK